MESLREAVLLFYLNRAEIATLYKADEEIIQANPTTYIIISKLQSMFPCKEFRIKDYVKRDNMQIINFMVTDRKSKNKPYNGNSDWLGIQFFMANIRNANYLSILLVSTISAYCRRIVTNNVENHLYHQYNSNVLGNSNIMETDECNGESMENQNIQQMEQDHPMTVTNSNQSESELNLLNSETSSTASIEQNKIINMNIEDENDQSPMEQDSPPNSSQPMEVDHPSSIEDSKQGIIQKFITSNFASDRYRVSQELYSFWSHDMHPVRHTERKTAFLSPNYSRLLQNTFYFFIENEYFDQMS